jgi:NAD(P)-dependent dehydrogenase (short-subunit alcohol dehydrogenase family)
MQQKIAVITGASSGLGLATAKSLLEKGWKVIATGRDSMRCLKAEKDLKAIAKQPENIVMLKADLAEMSEVANLAEVILKLSDHIDVLINNAGGVCSDYKLTSEGQEYTLAGNHLGHFLLTLKLLPALEKTTQIRGQGSARVLSVSSTGHDHYHGFDWSDMTMSQGYIAGNAYCRAKFANVMFTEELARRTASKGIIAHVIHPGVVETNFVNHTPPEMQAYMKTLDASGPEIPAKTLVFLAEDPLASKSNGKYWFNCEQVPANKAASDISEAKKLWDYSYYVVEKYF